MFKFEFDDERLAGFTDAEAYFIAAAPETIESLISFLSAAIGDIELEASIAVARGEDASGLMAHASQYRAAITRAKERAV